MKFVQHSGSRTWQQVIKQKWWVNQQRAINCVENYLAGNSDRQAMVRMPTGTGKTAVIATLAHLLADKPRCLVVAPWEYLVSQLQRELRERFWQKVGEDSSFTPKPCEIFTPSTFPKSVKAAGSAGVLLCTNQTLQTLRKYKSLFRKLRSWCTLALVDEGHREPAPRWAEAVRDLEVATVLFTATPYRNDLQLFDIDPAFTYSFTFGEALDEHIVRNVSFIDGSWPVSGVNVVREFVHQLTKSSASLAKQLGLKDSALRVIVRCDDAEQIKSVVAALLVHGETAIGIHETFGRADGKQYLKDVPEPSTETAQFWVHQNKLIEGVDDPSFRLIAIFGGFSNARNLVQQVGRVIRNPERKPGQMAFVLAHSKQRQRDLWDRFIEYEKDVQQQIAKGGSEISAFEQFIAARTASPRFYFLGDFRRHLQPENVTDPREVLRARKSVLVRAPAADFQWKNFLLGIQHELLTGDAAPYGTAYRDQSTFLQLFQISEQSDIVSEAYLETRLGYVFAKRVGDLLFFYDSEGRAPEYLRSGTTALTPEALQRLLPDRQSTIKQISLINGDFGNGAFQRRQLSTHSLEVVPPTLSDYVHVCSTVIGSVRTTNGAKRDTHRRYLSFTRGRLSERTTPIIGYIDFDKWVDEIAENLRNAALTGDDSLNRFAKPYQFIGTETPRHILFDVASEAIDSSAMPLLAVSPSDDDLWLVKNGQFLGEIDEQYFQASIQFNSQAGRFEIESDQLDEVYIDTPDGRRRIFRNYLNDTQEFRILLDSRLFTRRGGSLPQICALGEVAERASTLRRSLWAALGLRELPPRRGTRAAGHPHRFLAQLPTRARYLRMSDGSLKF